MLGVGSILSIRSEIALRNVTFKYVQLTKLINGQLYSFKGFLGKPHV